MTKLGWVIILIPLAFSGFVAYWFISDLEWVGVVVITIVSLFSFFVMPKLIEWSAEKHLEKLKRG